MTRNKEIIISNETSKLQTLTILFKNKVFKILKYDSRNVPADVIKFFNIAHL